MCFSRKKYSKTAFRICKIKIISTFQFMSHTIQNLLIHNTKINITKKNFFFFKEINQSESTKKINILVFFSFLILNPNHEELINNFLYIKMEKKATEKNS